MGSTKKLLELTNEFSMFARYNTDIQKSTVFYILPMQIQLRKFNSSNIKKNTKFRSNFNKTVYWNLPKLLRKIKDLNKWRISPCLWIGKINIV